MHCVTKKALLISFLVGIAYLPQLYAQSGGWSSSGGGGASGGHGGSGSWSSSGGGGASGGHGGSGGWSSGGGGYSQEPSYPPKPYNFNYDVNDHYSGTKFGQRENSDGQNVNGEYRVLLPDGRTQIVTYRADWKNGFVADVKYQGEARYPEPPKGGWSQQSQPSSGGYGK